VSTVVLTLVVVVGSFAVAAYVARHGERQPATELRPSHRVPPRSRPRARPAAAAAPPVTTVEAVEARPGFWVRLRGLVGYLAIVAVVGVGIALAVLAGVALAGRALESAVN
jgi:hypothetical protein